MSSIWPLALALAFAAAEAAQADVVRVDGSSTVHPISESAALEYRKAVRGARSIALAIAGTTGGFRSFCHGDTGITGASRPISKPEIEACAAAGIRYFELPIAYDAITVVVNPANHWLDSGISMEELKRIWSQDAQDRILTWKQVNPNWPDLPLRLFGPGADSGTLEYFTEAVVGKARASRRDYVASEDDLVIVQGLLRERSGLGYFGYAYYAENAVRLKAVAVRGTAGASAVLPSPRSVLDGSYRPLSRPLFIFVKLQALPRPEFRRFLDFYLGNASRLARAAGYVPLPEAVYAHNQQVVAKRRTGTRFGGIMRVGMAVKELVRIEAKD